MQGNMAALGPLAPQDAARHSLPATFWCRPKGMTPWWFTSNFRGKSEIDQWPGYGLIQTAPLQAGDLTLVAHVNEHRLTAVRNGREVWNFVAGGRIGSPPVIHACAKSAKDKRPLAIFACHDGHVYAVNLNDGSMAWRFLAAPADRRHTMLGQIESAWPVFNVVLDGDTLYCSAGRHEELDGGIHFYGLAAATGTIAWHVVRRRGMESDWEPYRRRKNHMKGWIEEEVEKGMLTPWAVEQNQKGNLYDGRAQMNDSLELRDGKLWLHGIPMVDVSAPGNHVMYAQTLAPPGLSEVSGACDVPALMESMRHPDLVTRLIAASKLGEQGDRAAVAAPALHKALKDDEVRMRAAAIRAMAKIGVLEPALADLLTAAGDTDGEVREAAGKALAKVGAAAVPGLITLLGKGTPAVARDAARALGRFSIPVDASAVPGLMAALIAEADETRKLCEKEAAKHRSSSAAGTARARVLGHRVAQSLLVQALARTGETGAKAVANAAQDSDDVARAYARAVEQTARDFGPPSHKQGK